MVCSHIVCVVLILAVLATSHSQAADVCPPEGCRFGGVDTVNCNSPDLLTFPSFEACKSFTFMIIGLTGTSVKLIPDSSLPANLQKLSIFEHEPLSFSDHAFHNCAQTLRRFSLEQIGLTKLPDALLELTALEEFHLWDETEITDWNLPVLKNIGRTVKDLLLHNTSLNSWPDWLVHFVSLTYLDIAMTSMTPVPDDALHQVSDTLKILYMRATNLTRVPKAFASLTALTELYLNENHITKVDNTPSSLLSLYLENNGITEISDDTFPQRNSFLTLNLRQNPITRISPNAFLHLSSLKELYLQDTWLSRLPLALSHLSSLDQLLMAVNSRLVCTCEESGLLPWFSSRPNMYVQGTCGDIEIKTFFTLLAGSCPGH
ncbi:leucine-rich repeat protein SHOC-2-like [Physella acuta]|uniref:leucine-rich repeat protein SHOC-2-like n=1 Tax=Physella acuta TaxID=109671 RepID=UPI0027DDD0D2|nr:leucine-rich repeat protein SHOC-2-like [Physella acuta]